MAAPPSLCAVALNEVAPETLAEAVAVADRGLGAEGALQRVLGVVGSLGRGEDVGDRLAHVAELGGAEAADVVDEGRGAEAGAGGDGRAHQHRRPPKRHQRVAVEQGHGAVADVIGRVAVAGTRHLGDAGQPALRAAHRLGHARRPRREDQEEERGLVDRRRHPQRGRAASTLPANALQQGVVALGCRRTRMLLVVDAEVQAVQQRRALVVGDDHGAVGGPDVGGQRLAPPGRVDADDGGAGQRGAVQPEEVLGAVGQEHPDVRFGVAEERAGQRAPGGALVRRPRARSSARRRP